MASRGKTKELLRLNWAKPPICNHDHFCIAAVLVEPLQLHSFEQRVSILEPSQCSLWTQQELPIPNVPIHLHCLLVPDVSVTLGDSIALWLLHLTSFTPINIKRSVARWHWSMRMVIWNPLDILHTGDLKDWRICEKYYKKLYLSSTTVRVAFPTFSAWCVGNWFVSEIIQDN